MRNPAVLSPSTKLVRAVHACRRKVEGLDDDTAWREFLVYTAGKSSLREMDWKELGRVLDALHRRGAPRTAPSAGRKAQAQGANAGLERKVRALWLSLHNLGEVQDPRDTAIAAFVKRQTGVDALHWCTPAQFIQVIEALRAMCGRGGFAVPEQADATTCNEFLIDAQWQKLIALGVMRTGAAARLETWLRKNYGVAHQRFLKGEQQLDAIARLGRWIRGAKAKSAPEAGR